MVFLCVTIVTFCYFVKRLVLVLILTFNSNLIFNYKNIEMKIAVVGATGMVGGYVTSISRKNFLSAADELFLLLQKDQ
jgi:hypothetical protein